MQGSTQHFDVAVIGGGLAGLTAANVLADRGHSVMIAERTNTLGGRASTTDHDGALFNEGPHALYLEGAGLATLRRLGIDPAGQVPGYTTAVGVRRGERGVLPMGPAALARTRLLSTRSKVEVGAVLARLDRIETAALADRSTQEWIESAVGRDDSRDQLASAMRLSTFVADLDRLSADVGVSQTQIGMAGVRYLDGGWGRLIDALTERAVDRGVQFSHGNGAAELQPHDQGWVVPVGDDTLTVRAAVLAGLSPAAAARLSGSAALETIAEAAEPASVATLDIALQSLPDETCTFALGLDEPFYFSLHGPPADLGSRVVIHAMKYLRRDDPASADDLRDQLAGFLDIVQPGWQDQVVTQRFLRRMTVSHRLATPETGGIAGRPGPTVADRPGIFLAGDWVGPTGHLADAAIASAASAAEATIGHLAQQAVGAP